MTRYELPTPRVLFGAIAVALTALTIGLFAVLPAAMPPGGHVQDIAGVAPTRQAAPEGLRHIDAIDVVVIRAPKVISAQERDARAKRGDQG